jgi:ankyrin repeat protein
VAVEAGAMVDEFARLIDAAKRGAVADVEAIVHHHPEFLARRDEAGATALHYAALGGHRDVAWLLVEHGADINAADGKFGATPAGWAIEYLREMGGLLGIELDDFANAIKRGDADWVKRFLARFPGLRHARDIHGKPFETLAAEVGNDEIASLFLSGNDDFGPGFQQ